MTVVFDDAGHASTAGTIRVFHYISSTGEYRGWSDEYIPVGVSLPGSSTVIDPGEDIAGHAWVFDGDHWVSKEDHRGEIVYSTETGLESAVGYIGDINNGYTPIAPATPFDKWDGEKWVTDAYEAHAADVEAAVQKKSALRKIADSEIEWRKYAVDKGIATAEESAAFDEWNLYRVLLMRIDTSKAPDIEWPATPSA